MGTTKTDLFTEEQNQVANIAKVFAHPARVAIVQYLLNTKGCINSDLVSELGLAQATISQHLKELKKIELIQGEITGAAICYCINDKNWLHAKEIMNQLFDLNEEGMQRCC